MVSKILLTTPHSFLNFVSPSKHLKYIEAEFSDNIYYLLLNEIKHFIKANSAIMSFPA